MDVWGIFMVFIFLMALLWEIGGDEFRRKLDIFVYVGGPLFVYIMMCCLL